MKKKIKTVLPVWGGVKIHNAQCIMHNELTSFLFKKFKSCLSLLMIFFFVFSLFIRCSDDDPNNGDNLLPGNENPEPQAPAEDFTIDLSTLPWYKNTDPFQTYEDTYDLSFLIRLPEYEVDYTKYSRFTIKAKYFDINNVELPQSNNKAMVVLIYDPDGDIKGPQQGPGPNTPLKEFNIGGIAGRVHRDPGALIAPLEPNGRLTKKLGAILLQPQGNPDVKYIEVTEIKFHNSALPVYEVPPMEKWPVYERWSKNFNGAAALDYSIDNDGVVAVTVSGTPDSDRWKADIRFLYSAVTNQKYVYKFEAWTEEGNRVLAAQYYNGWGIGDEPYTYLANWNLEITSTRKTYTVIGDVIPAGGTRTVEFQCADKLGKFYLKMISIEEYTE